jgi:hypothetical protein
MVKSIAKQPSPDSNSVRERKAATPRGGSTRGCFIILLLKALRRIMVIQAASVGHVRQMLHGRKAARSTVHDAGRCKGEWRSMRTIIVSCPAHRWLYTSNGRNMTSWL